MQFKVIASKTQGGFFLVYFIYWWPFLYNRWPFYDKIFYNVSVFKLVVE